jgi:hypothetical protein
MDGREGRGRGRTGEGRELRRKGLAPKHTNQTTSMSVGYNLPNCN